VSSDVQSQMMRHCAICGGSALEPHVSSLLTLRSREGRMGIFRLTTIKAYVREAIAVEKAVPALLEGRGFRRD
jgi:hypothetical protein